MRGKSVAVLLNVFFALARRGDPIPVDLEEALLAAGYDTGALYRASSAS